MLSYPTFVIAVILVGASSVMSGFTLTNKHEFRKALDEYLRKFIDTDDVTINIEQAKNFISYIGPDYQNVDPAVFMEHALFLGLNGVMGGVFCNITGRQIILDNLQDLDFESPDLKRFSGIVKQVYSKHAHECVPKYLQELHNRYLNMDLVQRELMDRYTDGVVKRVYLEGGKSFHKEINYDDMADTALEFLEQYKDNPDIKLALFKDGDDSKIPFSLFKTLMTDYFEYPCEYYLNQTGDLFNLTQYVVKEMPNIEGIKPQVEFYKLASMKHEVCNRIVNPVHRQKHWLVDLVAELVGKKLHRSVDSEFLLGEFFKNLHA